MDGSMDKDIPMENVQGLTPLDTSTLPIFQRYKEENESWIPDFDTWSYLNLRADFDLAAAFAKMFWPDFVEVEDCVILQRNYSLEAFAEWMERYDGDRRAVESMLNHTHIADLFLNSPRDVTYPDELYEFVAHALIYGWKQALHDKYPEKRFIFMLRLNPDAEISFYQADQVHPVKPEA
jgi:hypothetical protein